MEKEYKDANALSSKLDFRYVLENLMEYIKIKNIR